MEEYQGIRIVYEDNHILVVVKPPNMPSQSDPTGDLDVLSAMKLYLAEKYGKKGEVYLGLVHRLDRPVGGLMVLARTGKAADRLSAQVREKTLSRQYVAAVRGDVPESAELCDWLLKNARTNMVRVVPEGTARAKEARLRFARVGSAKDLTLVRVRLFTGRSHQIRVQLSHAGMPIWGDARYGRGRPGEQIALWGMHLGLVHPTKRERMDFIAPPPREGAPWRSFGEEIWEAEGKISL